MHKTLLSFLVVAAVGCGSDSSKNVDAKAGGSDAAVDAAPLTLDCQSYCTGIQAACTGTHSQFSSMQNCMDTCAKWTPGTLGAQSGDTLACRVYHTMAAQSDPTTHCTHAGPTGGGVCGTNTCATFCPLESAICAGTYAANGAQSCATLCPGFASTNMPYNSMDQSGNTIECRFYHLTAASTDPTTHCPHTSSTGGGVCQ